MKRFLIIVFVVSQIIFFNFSVFASEQDIKDDISSDLFSSLSDEAKQSLEDVGLNGIDFEQMIDLSPKNIISFLFGVVSKKINGPIKLFLIILCIVFILSAMISLFPDDEKRKNMLLTVACIIVAAVSMSSFFSLIKSAMSVIDITTKFMYTLLPILAGLIAACKNPVLAVSMNSVAIYIASIISSFADKYLSPFMSIYFALCSAGCFSRELNFSSLAAFIKNTVTKLLSILSAFFISFLSIKGIFTNSVDTVTSKGVKLLISSAVPIIGSSLSDAYFAVSGSLSLLKNSVGVFSIVAIAVTNLPMIIELFLFSSLFSLTEMICNVLNLDTVESYLSTVCCVFRTLNIILIFCVTLFIISIGLMISIRSGV